MNHYHQVLTWSVTCNKGFTLKLPAMVVYVERDIEIAGRKFRGEFVRDEIEDQQWQIKKLHNVCMHITSK